MATIAPSPAAERSVPGTMGRAFRWIVFIPGGMLGGVLAGFAGFLFFGASCWLTGFGFDCPLVYFLSGFWSGYAVVASGVWIAPTTNKFGPAVTMSTIGSVTGLVAVFLRLGNQEWFRSIEGLVVIAGVIAAGWQYVKARGARKMDE